MVQVSLGERSYTIHVGRGLLAGLGARIAELMPGRRALIIDDANVSDRFGGAVQQSLTNAGFSVHHVTLPPGEATKSLEFAANLWDQCLDAGLDRQSVVIAVGGGVMGDLAGFVAATFARGISFVQVPTTLLAMVDASVGGKVGIDHPKAKNIIGAFHQPKLVVCDLETMSTLPDREFRCGLAEVVKYGAILDRLFFEYLEAHAEAISRRDPETLEHIVRECCRIKASVVEQDEFERTGLRAVLNYGHTFAHAFETASNYDALHHGEAVAIGMMCAATLGARMNQSPLSLFDRQSALWRRLGLPVSLPAELAQADLIPIMQRDKKAKNGKLHFVLATELGKGTTIGGVDPELVRNILVEAARW